MHICLVTPPSGFLLDQKVFMSLGILKVGAVLENQGHQVSHLDLTGIDDYENVTHSIDADVYAITATTPQIPAAVRIAVSLKGKKTVLGGPHVTLVNAAARQKNERATNVMADLLQKFDCLVAGDGERAIFRALQEYGLIDADDPNSLLWQTSKDFTESPWPARHLVDVDSYHYDIDGERALSMITQLGCPFECGFCGGRLSPSLRRIRTRPASSVIAEMMHLNKVYGVKGLMFYDDELNVNKNLVGLLQDIKKTGIDWRLRGFIKAELFNEDQAKAMYEAGFRWLLCGFESAHPRILKNINKKASLEDNTRVIEIAHKYGLKVKALMSVGHPGESYETVDATRQWLLQHKPDDFDCTVITVYGGTPYYDKSVPVNGHYCYTINNDNLYSEEMDINSEAQYYKGKPGEYRSYVWTDYLSATELVKLRDEVEAEVRHKLGIPYPAAAVAVNYDHSMGQV